MRVSSFHAIRSLPVALKTAETMKKWSLRVARGRPFTGSFTGLSPGVTAPNIDRNSTPLELLKLFFTDFLLLILVQETNRYCHQYYAAKGDDS
jgi:hypothetical protein